MAEQKQFQLDLEHACPKEPGVLTQRVAREKESGEWWVLAYHINRFAGVWNSKVRQLEDGICPWCTADLMRLATIWPHRCPREGEGAKELVSQATTANPQSVEEQVQVTLDVDPNNPTQGIYQVRITQTYKAAVTKCPDCGADLY